MTQKNTQVNNTTDKISRRELLAATAISAAASPLFIPSNALGREGQVPPNDQIPLALIGYGNRGGDIIRGFRDVRRGFRAIAFADCQERQRERAKRDTDAHYQNKDSKVYERYEDILDRDDINVIVIATPDHWHTKIAVESCKAGKDVFSEKPLTHTPMESREIVAAARKYNRVCSSGSQRVWEDYGHKMVEIVQSGAIGEVKEAWFSTNHEGKDCYLPAQEIPKGFNWDRWLGPAPWRPYNSERCSGNYGGGWRRWWDYGNGFFADWGAHRLGGILYILGIDDQEPVEMLPPNCEANPQNCVVYIYKNDVKIYHTVERTNMPQHDVTIVGSEGTITSRDLKNFKPIGTPKVRRYNGGARNIQDDFCYCVRNRIRPFQDFLYGAATATACQLANIVVRMGRPLKWDAQKTAFVNDEQANRFVVKPKRGQYEINS
ncbi:MAG: Gfo/Idh/MocA family oxidoreductase [Planctomycetaceae bacterium]|jgi:predicted dehydrogenase|nr:Gfo/Idh/MocA family oxidoreductase [Planctomycetaceae bacterium]